VERATSIMLRTSQNAPGCVCCNFLHTRI